MSELVPVSKWREKPSGKAEISPQMEAALCALVATSCTQAEAAQAAGLTREHLCKALRKSHVQARYQALLRERLHSMAPKALGTVEDLMCCDSSYVRLHSAVVVLDRVGLRPVEASPVAAEVNIRIDLS